MADAAKKEKIAAAKKKLKQFQQKSSRSTPSPKITANGDGSRVNGTPKRGSGANSPALAPSPVSNSVSHSSDSATDSSQTSSKSQLDHLNSPKNNPGKLSASTEHLHQLSRQINGLITESSAYLKNNDDVTTPDNNRDIAELELRNRHLAELLQKHMQANELLNQQITEIRQQNHNLNTSLEGEKKTFDDKYKREIGALKEQLQVHIQTIGILVAEKTELQSSLNQNGKLAESRLREIEELSGRLKASRQRVAELERNYTNISSSVKKHEQTSKESSKEVDRLKLELYKLNKSNEEYQQQNSELQAKLQKKVSESSGLEDTVIDLRGQLELSQLHVQQLQNGNSNPDMSHQVDVLVSEKSELQTKLAEYEDSFQKLNVERDQIRQQYQHYVDQLGAQSSQLQQQISELSEERDSLVQTNDTLNTSLSELKDKQDSVVSDASVAEKEQNQLRETLGGVQEEYSKVSEQYQIQVTNNAQLSRLVEEREERIIELETSIQRLGENAVDHQQLLESMQSDKTALSRAIAQNKELKHQLAELQNGFVKMSNDNMDLLNKMTSEQHVAKELGSRLGQQEDELKELREQLSVRDRELKDLQEQHQFDIEKQSYTDKQIEDRLRHFEAQAQLVDTLQRELSSAQDTINALTNQNTLLQSQVSKAQDSSNANDDSHRLESFSASIKQLEMERDQVMAQLKEEKHERENVANQLQNLQQELASATPATLNGDVINKAQFEALQHAMKQLETKYTKIMRDKADLADQKDNLEHLIMQLEGETETIGEYVTLYQHQRSLLKQRTLEKDDYISQLARDRTNLQDKLGQLQVLMMQLLNERQMLHSYHDNSSSSTTTPLLPGIANHVPHPSDSHKPNKSSLDATPGEDWPDYDSDSDTSLVEPIIGQSSAAELTSTSTTLTTSTPSSKMESPASFSTPPHISANDHTAQQIMHLLTELGTPNVVDRRYDERNFIHCRQCSGRLINV